MNLISQKPQQEIESTMKTIAELRVKIFADGADKAGMLEMAAKPFIKGLTTNPERRGVILSNSKTT